MNNELELSALANVSDGCSQSDSIYRSDLNNTGIKPCGYKLLVEIPEVNERRGSLYVPQSTARAEKVASVVARVLQLGSDCYRNIDRYPNGAWCQPGDLVVMSPYNGTRVKSSVTNADLRFINEDSIDGIVDTSDLVERG